MRYEIPEFGLEIGNDTPAWLKPRRTVWFVLRNRVTVCGKSGNPRYFKTSAAAAKAMERIAEGERNG